MKTLHLYLTRQVLATLAVTVAVFTFVLLLGNIMKDVLGLLVSGQVGLGTVFQAIGLLIPFVWVFALPLGMLTATLLVFGRFSADQELTAARAGGVSLISLSAPILVLSLAFCGFCAWVNMDLGPRSRTMHKQLFFKLLSSKVSAAQIPEGRYITKYQDRGFIFFVGKNRDGNLEDVIVYKLGTGTNFPTTITASRGNLVVDATNNSITLNLLDARTVSFEGDQSVLSHDASYLERSNYPAQTKSWRKIP